MASKKKKRVKENRLIREGKITPSVRYVVMYDEVSVLNDSALDRISQLSAYHISSKLKG